MFRGFESEAIRPPIYEVNITPFIKGNAGVIKFDLAMPQFDVIRKLVRSGFLLLFGFGLAMVTRKVIKW